MTEDEMVGWHHQLNDISWHKLQEIVKNKEAWHAAIYASGRAVRKRRHSNWKNMKSAITCGKKNIVGKEVCECEVSKVRKNA